MGEWAMQILFYLSSGIKSGNRLKQTLDEVLPGGNVEVFRQVNGLIQRLRTPSSDLEILILMPTNRLELSAMSTLLTDFRNVRLVLVLPDEEEETITIAHRMRPRFLTYSSGDYSELREVLMKMLKDSAKGESGVDRR